MNLQTCRILILGSCCCMGVQEHRYHGHVSTNFLSFRLSKRDREKLSARECLSWAHRIMSILMGVHCQAAPNMLHLSAIYLWIDLVRKESYLLITTAYRSISLIAIDELEKTGKFSIMNKETDEDEHSIEMHLPYVRKIFMK